MRYQGAHTVLTRLLTSNKAFRMSGQPKSVIVRLTPSQVEAIWKANQALGDALEMGLNGEGED